MIEPLKVPVALFLVAGWVVAISMTRRSLELGARFWSRLVSRDLGR